MKKIYTISIGIPAHNEALNISNLINGILNQSGNNFELEKIYVFCDGCTDDTYNIVNNISNVNEKVSVINDGKRLGKIRRLSQIFRINKSDIIFVFDGDVYLTQNVIELMVERFLENEKVILVSGNSTPIEESGIFGKMIYTWSRVWYEARALYKNGNNLHNSRGCCLALKKEFAKNVKFKKSILSDSQYIYFSALKSNGVFRFSKDAIVYFRKPNNLEDYTNQMTRSSGEKSKMVKAFGKWVAAEYVVPDKYKFMGILKVIIQQPFWTPLALLYNLYLNKYFSRKKYKDISNWNIAVSTKRQIKI